MKTLFEYTVRTSKRIELVNITDKVRKSIVESGIRDGICVIFVPHTTAGVTINENADPDVCHDINQHLEKIIPQDADFNHSEGNSDAHIKSSLVGASISVIIENNNPVLGTWQSVYFTEFDGPRSRQVYIKCIAS